MFIMFNDVFAIHIHFNIFNIADLEAIDQMALNGIIFKLVSSLYKSIWKT